MAKRLVILFDPADRRFAARLKDHLAPLAHRGLAAVWDREQIPPGEAPREQTLQHLDQADVVLSLVSPRFLASEPLWELVQHAMRRQRRGEVILVPIVVRTSLWQKTPLGEFSPLPRDGRSIAQYGGDRQDQAWQEVAYGIARLLEMSPSPRRQAEEPPEPGQPPPTRVPLTKIFVRTGRPTHTLVEPSHLSEIRRQLQIAQEGLVIEGPSGIGKTTAIRTALDELKSARVHRLTGADRGCVALLERILGDGYPARGGYLVVDDFHRLEPGTKQELARLMKLIADEGPDNAKVVLVGVNPIGDSLIRDLPDLTGRYVSIRMGKEPETKIKELIVKGEAAANIEFARRDRIIELAAGSFAIAQLLCYEAALQEGITETESSRRVIQGDLDGPVVDKVLLRLSDRFHIPLFTFATCDEAPPPRGAGLVLLWMLAKAEDGKVSLEVARGRYPALRSHLDWFMKSNLARHFADHPRLHELLYYNRDAAMLSADDPRIQFYLRNLSWSAFLRDTGHPPSAVSFDPDEGPQVPPRGTPAPVPEALGPGRASLPDSTVLHLSDLHFGTRDQATRWLDQLVEDLHVLGCKRLDAVVLSGDIADRAEPLEYQAALQFVLDLKQEYKLAPEHLIVVPGDHDLSWARSKRAFTPVRREDLPKDTELESCIDQGGPYIEVRDDGLFRERFKPFADFYAQVRAEPYPLEEDRQFTLYHLPVQRLLLLGLNSAWGLDHFHTDRASIHTVALGQALRQIRNTEAYADSLKIAIWHHPVQSEGDDRIRDTGFLERLAAAGFRLALHGHVHSADGSQFRLDWNVGGRRIDLIGAGTFGARWEDRPPGIPLQYQLLRFSAERLEIETRRREKDNGIWRPDARWEQGPDRPPLPRYTILL